MSIWMNLLDEVSMQIADRLNENNVTLEILAPRVLASSWPIISASTDPDQTDHQCCQFRADNSTITLSSLARWRGFLLLPSPIGPGIPEEMLPTVFNRFSSGRAASEAVQALGLSIVESFVNLQPW